MNEQELRESKSPTPSTIDELREYINHLTEQPHDYGTCVYAMSLSAMAAFNFAASKLGVTGFQASCADLDFLRRSRNMQGPFMILDLQDAIYPQNDLARKVADFQHRNRFWLRAAAMKKMAESPKCNPDVFAHWLRLTSETPATTEDVESWNQNNPEDKITDAAEYSGRAQTAWLSKYEHLEFLRELCADETESFVEKNAGRFLALGIKQIHLRSGSISKADTVKTSGLMRCNISVGLEFTRNIEGVEVSWFEDTELPDSNGTSGLRVDFDRLESLANQAKPEVATGIQTYIIQARAAAVTSAGK